MNTKVILVDRSDKEIGLEEKMAAHKKGDLHRAISVYIFNSKGQLMMQQRAAGVYHSPFVWSNTCCSNCYEGESAAESAHRSLKNEMGFDCKLTEMFTQIYKTPVTNGMTEHEFLHVFFGRHEETPKINSEEVMDWKWVNFQDLSDDIKKNGKEYSAWLRILIKGQLKDEVEKYIKKKST